MAQQLKDTLRILRIKQVKAQMGLPKAAYSKTFEGNTNDEGSREGYEACYRTRKQSSIKGYIRILN